MTTITDQLGRTIVMESPPRRIVSLAPSQTELLYDLGLENEVVGITKFCVHPESWFRNKTLVGGTKKVNLERVIDLQPDLILANKEENTQEDIQALERIAPEWISDIRKLSDALDMIAQVGELVHRAPQAERIIQQIKDDIASLSAPSSREQVLYLIWKDPYMAAGRDTFIHEMLEMAGFDNVLKDEQSRYPELSVEDILSLHPDVIFLSSEPFPFIGKHTSEVEGHFPDIEVLEVDGELFSWYGSRMIKAIDYMKKLRQQRTGNYLS